MLAFAQTSNDEQNESTERVWVYDETQFVRPPQRYTHLLYDQSVTINPLHGSEPFSVVQPLPKIVDNVYLATPLAKQPALTSERQALRHLRVEPATPLAELPVNDEALYRVSSAYSTFRLGESIVVKDQSVWLRNANASEEKMLLRGIESRENFDNIFVRVAISPDGKRLAAATLRAIVGPVDRKKNPLFDLYVFDICSDETKPQKVGDGFYGDSVMGGGVRPYAVAPPIFWADAHTLLVATPGEQKIGRWLDLPLGETVIPDLQESGVDAIVRDGEVLTPTHDLLRIDLRNGSAKKVCDLKLGVFQSQPNTTDFWRRSDGAIMLRSRNLDIRIDFNKRQAITDRRLSPQYDLRGDRRKPSLFCGDEQLAEVVSIDNVGIAPDGRSVAWYARTIRRDTSNLGNTSQFPTTLWYHSTDTGTVKLCEGRFAFNNSWNVFDNPILNSRFHWLTQTDF